MKALFKKKYPKKKDAITRLVEKFGDDKSFKVAKKHKNKWLFNIVPNTKNDKQTITWKEFSAQYRANNKDVAYREAMAKASVLYKYQKAEI